ncbi:MAG: hypothetical protein ABIH83_00330 [Candidatus Micrarchaeota archaeon]
MKIKAFAPGKIILFGEHFVVYGAEGVVGAVEPSNEIEINMEERGEGGLEYNSTIKECSLKISAKECMEKENIKHPIEAVYCKLLMEIDGLEKYEINADAKKCWPMKGVGNSASLSGAFACGVRKELGKEMSENIIFEYCMAGDEAAHGKPSGIDATAVSRGGMLEFKKKFDGSKPEIKKLDIKLGGGHSFLLVNTLKKGRERANTVMQIEKFAKNYNIKKKPEEMNEGERKEICGEYEKILENARKAFESGDMEKLGKCMNNNHKLLVKGGVSSKDIEKVVEIALNAGCLGAKLSGAGGEGGVVVALVENNRINEIKRKFEDAGFSAYKFKLAEKGANCLS